MLRISWQATSISSSRPSSPSFARFSGGRLSMTASLKPESSYACLARSRDM